MLNSKVNISSHWAIAQPLPILILLLLVQLCPAQIYAQIDSTTVTIVKPVSNWLVMLVIGLIGGLAMFLYGMDQMSDGLKKSAGSKIRSILKSLTQNRFIGVLVGVFVTMVIQSSSATTVMLVSFVQAQLMTFSQSLGIILGADIGTTITAQLIAFRLTDVALLFVAIGLLLKFVTKNGELTNLGIALMGFGLLFYGMHIMSESMSPLRNYTPFLNILSSMRNPLFGVLVGAIFTALIQSSAAFIGIVIVLAQQNLVTLNEGIPLLFGANIGTCITALLASLNTSREAKRVALAHTFFKVGGVLVFIGWIPYYVNFISGITDNLPRQIAHAHTVFNVGLTILFFPFAGVMAKLITRILPDKKLPEVELPYKIKFLKNNLIPTPALALTLAKKEILRMGEKVKKMVEGIITPFLDGKLEFEKEVEQQEEEIDFLQEKITEYLTKISRQSISEQRIDEVFQMMHTVIEMEQIGDIVSKSLVPLAIKKQKLGCDFSKAGKDEIADYHTRSIKQISRALDVFEDVDLEKAERMKKKYKKYRFMEMSLRRTHFERLRQDIPESVASDEIHLELMDYLRRISSHATSIARMILDVGKIKNDLKGK